MNLKSLFPFLEWIKSYNKDDFNGDLVAGLTVWVMLVPQGMAYALLAGMPPIYGLYGGLVPLFLYGLLGTSRQLSIGPVAVSALLVFAGISQLAEPMSEEYISLVILTGLLIGVMQLLLGFIKMGFFVNFLSHPVLAGFISAAAVIIGISQLKHLFGIQVPDSDQMFDTLLYILGHLSEANIPSLLLGVGGLLAIIVLKKINKKIPGPLLVVVIGILITKFANLETAGLSIAGEVPSGLPSIILPDLNIETIKAVMPTVLTVTIIGIVESIGIAKALEAKKQTYKVYPNQELKALGISKMVGSFFQALPTSGSFTRTAVNDEAGARTGMSSILTAVLIGMTLLFLTPLFYHLPLTILASIIMVSVIGLFDFQEAKYLWKVHRQDFLMMVLTFLITLLMGIEIGVLVGVVLSIALIVYRSSQPHYAILGKLPGKRNYRNVTRFPEAELVNDVLIIRFDAPIFFANADFFKELIKDVIEERQPVKMLLLDASSILEIDSSGLHAFDSVLKYLEKKEIELYICGALGPARDSLFKSGLSAKIGWERQFLGIEEAVDHYQKSKQGNGANWSKDAIQTNVGGKK